jgi:2-polyprenyl-6-methoxyphenol hydroxylase-like FAD-dependent oxidoreductase
MAGERAEVLIIGAGPVGLTLANELARREIATIVVDKAPGIREVSKALILHVRTQEHLSRVGAASKARAEGQPLTEVVVHAYGKHLGSWDLDDIDSPYPHPIILGQNRTQHILEDLLRERGVAVAWNTEALEVDIREDGVSSRLVGPDKSERRVDARYVIGCEGSNSLVRKTLGFTFEGERYSGEQFIQADCKLRWALPAGRSYLFLTADGYMMAIEMPDGLVRIFISLPDDSASGAAAAANQLGAVEATSEQPTLEEVAHHLTRLSGFTCDLSDPVWLARYRTSHRYADRFREGSGFVAGDAGHVHVPIGGQGMNTGIHDACNLGWKLAGVVKGELKPEVLDSYQAERHPVAEGLIRGTDMAYRGVLHPSELRQRAARMIGPFLLRSGRVQDFMRETLEELSISYPDSSLNFGSASGGKCPGAGTRMLDAPVVWADDMSDTTLWDAADPLGWTLFMFGGANPDAAAKLRLDQIAEEFRARFGERVRPLTVLRSRSGAEPAPGDNVLLDALGLAHDRYGATQPTLVLVRPDTYVAASIPADRWEGLKAHLAGIFV